VIQVLLGLREIQATQDPQETLDRQVQLETLDRQVLKVILVTQAQRAI
jgi:hypothetical protein